MNAEFLFRMALTVSVGAHVTAMAVRADGNDGEAEYLVRIPVVLEAEPQLEPPPAVEALPKKAPEPRQRPATLPRRVAEVVEADGLRAGDLVDAEVGEYSDDVASEPAPAVAPPPAPPPPPKAAPPEPAVDRVALTRAYLQRLRRSLAARKVYPLAAQRMGITGSVTVSFVVGPSGTFSSISTVRASGFAVLDRAALATVQGLSGQLSRPPEIGRAPLRTSVVLRYQMHL